MLFETILPVLIAFFVVTVSPGPANIAVATIAMSQGRRRGIQFGLGLSLGLAFWGLVAATGLGVILEASEYALFALKIFGGAYLLWLAYQSGKSAMRKADNADADLRRGNWFYRGLLLNLSNPKAVVAWMAALSMGLDTGDSAIQLAAVTAICMVLGLINYLGHAFAFSFTGVMAGYKRFRRMIDGAVAGLFSLAGFGLIRSAFTR